MPDGKGAALAAVPDEILQGDAVFAVFDADARIGADLVRRVAERVGDGHAAFTARRRVAGSDLCAVVQDDEQTVDTLVQRPGGWPGRLPGVPGQRHGRDDGAPARHRRMAGRHADGGPRPFPTRLAVRGTHVVLADDAGGLGGGDRIRLPAFVRQRVRWAEGSVRRFLDFLPRPSRART